MVVEVHEVLGQYLFEVMAVDDQHSIQQFAASGADPSFSDRVRSRCSYRRAQNADALAGEHGIEGIGELAVSISDHDRELSRASTEIHHEVSRLLNNPAFVRVRGDAQEMDAASGVLDDEQHVQPLQQQRIDAEEVRGENALRLGCEELSPGGSVTARCRVNAKSLQD
jgi:hypothetical protein